MTKEERMAYRILASLYPDRKPSEVRKIIDETLAKDASKDDIELWRIIAAEKPEEPKKDVPEPIKETIVEKHYYHDGTRWWYGPYYYNGITTSVTTTSPSITYACADTASTSTITADAATLSASSVSDFPFDSITISSNTCTL